jgi:hypothetical protein
MKRLFLARGAAKPQAGGGAAGGGGRRSWERGSWGREAEVEFLQLNARGPLLLWLAPPPRSNPGGRRGLLAKPEKTNLLRRTDLPPGC